MRRTPLFARDPFAASVTLAVALIVSGLIVLALAWRGAAATVVVSEQVPYIVSGGFGGLGLIAFALGVLAMQRRRWSEARRRAELDRVVRMAAELLDAATEGIEGQRP